ncbi:S8 family peptidase [Streptomyces sp. NPDC005526]|uniref:S8 family peptidase n=1 Tax=Streptomyces sp. NPDC005526 TaxID=3156885 RepID=UPI0033BCDDE9
MARTRTRRLRRAGGLIAAVCAAALSAATLPAHAAPEGQVSGAGRPGSVAGSYLVTSRAGTPAASAAGRAVATAHGARVGQTHGTALNGYAVRAGAGQARRLAADPRGASAVQDVRVRLDRTPTNPPSRGLDRFDQRTLPLNRTYTAPDAGGRGVTVHVIDAGVRITHRDFGGRAGYGWDFVGHDPAAGDGNGHGTHVAGIVAGTAHGVAKRARVVAVRVLGDDGTGTMSRVIAGIDWVTRHARKPAVADLSLGGPYDAQLDAAVRASIRSGVTYTVAAGNGGRAAALFSPADVREAITVGAVDGRDARAGFSNTGSALDLFAPGVSITSASAASDTSRATFSGTSTAAPYAAGAAALHLSGHPRAAPAQVAKALVTGAATGRVGDPGPGSPNRLVRVPTG